MGKHVSKRKLLDRLEKLERLKRQRSEDRSAASLHRSGRPGQRPSGSPSRGGTPPRVTHSGVDRSLNAPAHAQLADQRPSDLARADEIDDRGTRIETGHSPTLNLETDIQLPEATLEILGDDPGKKLKEDSSLHSAISSRWTHYLTNGIPKNDPSSILTKYDTPANCPTLIPPELNAEAVGALSAAHAKPDSCYTDYQKEVARGLSALGHGISTILGKQDKTTTSQSNQTSVLSSLVDTGKILTSLFFNISNTRRSLILPLLDKPPAPGPSKEGDEATKRANFPSIQTIPSKEVEPLICSGSHHSRRPGPKQRFEALPQGSVQITPSNTQIQCHMGPVKRTKVSEGSRYKRFVKTAFRKIRHFIGSYHRRETTDVCFNTNLKHRPRQYGTAPYIRIPFYHDDPKLCVATLTNTYISTTKNIRGEDDYLFTTFSKPHKQAKGQTIARWTKTTLQAPSVDTYLFKPQSTRHASTSAAFRRGIPLETIFKTAGWTDSSSTFGKFYNRPILEGNSYVSALSNKVQKQNQVILKITNIARDI
nr:unnamed protein product [Callosobruchus analis]